MSTARSVPRRATRPPGWVVPVLVAAWWVVHAVLLLRTPAADLSLTLLLLPQLVIWGALALTLVAAEAAREPEVRAGWRWLALGQLVTAVLTARHPLELLVAGARVSPGWLSQFAVLAIPCFVVGIMRLGGARPPVDAAGPRLFRRDAAILLAAVVVLFAVFGLWPLAVAAGSPAAAVGRLVPPLGWLAVISAACVALYRPVEGRRRIALTLLLAAFLGRFVADTVFATGELENRNLVRLIWTAAFALQCWAPWAEYTAGAAVPRWVADGLSARMTSVLAFSIVFLSLLAAESGRASLGMLPLATGSVLVAVLVLVRQSAHDRAVRQLLEERHAQELQLRDAERMVSIGHLAASVAHDFGNLLMVVDANAHDLRALGLPPEAEQRLAEIAEATARGAALSRRLMRMSTRPDVTPEPIAVDAQLRALAPLLGRMLPATVRLRLDLRAPHAAVFGDALQLEQAVMNLVWNARDAMPAGGDLVIATAPVAGRDGWMALEVRDTGIGMDATTQARAFERFFTTKATGAGIGLATVQAVVAELRGTVVIRSQPGEGTTFRLELPEHVEPDVERPAPATRTGALTA